MSRLQSATCSMLTIQIKHRYKSANTMQNALPSPVRYIGDLFYKDIYTSQQKTPH